MNGTPFNRKKTHSSSSSRTTITTLLSLAAAAACLSSTLLVAAETTSSVSSTAVSSSPSGNLGGCVEDYDPSAGVDYFPDKAVLEYATTFTVEYFPSYKVLNVIGFSTSTYVLYQCGTPEPVLDNTVVQQYIEVPVTNVSTGTPDHIPRIEVGFFRKKYLLYQ